MLTRGDIEAVRRQEAPQRVIEDVCDLAMSLFIAPLSELKLAAQGEGRIAALEAELAEAQQSRQRNWDARVDAQPGSVVSWCPECGPEPRCDEDGCCLGCGATTGCVPDWRPYVEQLRRAEAERNEARQQRDAAIAAGGARITELFNDIVTLADAAERLCTAVDEEDEPVLAPMYACREAVADARLSVAGRTEAKR